MIIGSSTRKPQRQTEMRESLADRWSATVIPEFKEFVLPRSVHADISRTSSPIFSRTLNIAAPSTCPPRLSRQDGSSQPPQVQHSYSYENSQASSTASNGGASGAAAQLEDGKQLGPGNLVGLEKQLVSRTQQEVKTQQVQLEPPP